jgi:outer membrane lipoprotein-sorting protein
MPYLRLLLPLISLFCAYPADNPLQSVFSRMDSAAAGFKGLRADLTQTSHVDVMNDDTVESGKIAVRRTGRKDIRMIVHMLPPNERKVSLGSSKVEIYYPKMNTVEEYDFGKAGALRDQLMTLAFGSTSKDLLSAYTVEAGGAETVAGQKTTRLDLVPKDKELRARFPKIQLWISDDSGLTVQQTMHQPGKDYIRATYSNIQPAALSESDVKLDVPRDAKRGVKPLNR